MCTSTQAQKHPWLQNQRGILRNESQCKNAPGYSFISSIKPADFILIQDQFSCLQKLHVSKYSSFTLLISIFNNDKFVSWLGVICSYMQHFRTARLLFLTTENNNKTTQNQKTPQKLRMLCLLGSVDTEENQYLAASRSVAKLLSFNRVLEMLARLDALPFKSSPELLN